MMSTDLTRAKEIVRQLNPGTNPELACMLVASALAGMRGLTMRHIRIGTLFWPTKFADDPHLSMRGGWGCEGYSHADKRLSLSDPQVDEDGGFNGHTWLEPEPETVVDLMHDVEESTRDIYDADWKIAGRYIPRRDLERSVKGYWRTQMQAAIKAGQRSSSK